MNRNTAKSYGKPLEGGGGTVYPDSICALRNACANGVSASKLGSKVSTWPVIDLTIAKDGKMSRAFVVSKSSNKAVDDAVTALLAKLKVVPVPPQACTIRVALDIL